MVRLLIATAFTAFVVACILIAAAEPVLARCGTGGC